MSESDSDLVLFWKREGGVRCVALKRPPARARDKRWELRVVNGDRLVKRELFQTFRRAMRAAATWREDFGVDSSFRSEPFEAAAAASRRQEPQPWDHGAHDVHEGQDRQDDVT